MPQRLRTFLAVDVSDPARAALHALRQRLTPRLPGANWVPRENYHVTLLFLGEVDARETPAVCRAASAVTRAREPFRLGTGGLGCFPNAKKPRTLWAGVTAGSSELRALHAGLEAAMLDLGCYRREERSYEPHLTLARFDTPSAEGVVEEVMSEHATWSAGDTGVTEVLILTSDLTRKAPVYSPIGRAHLGEPPPEVIE